MLPVKSIALVALVLSGCSGDSAISDNSLMTGESAPVLPAAAVPPEKLGAHYDSGQIIAQVISNGCTRADQFSVSHVVSENNCVLSIQRDTPDFCKRASFVQQIEIIWPLIEECQDRAIVFANPPLSDD